MPQNLVILTSGKAEIDRPTPAITTSPATGQSIGVRRDRAPTCHHRMAQTAARAAAPYAVHWPGKTKSGATKAVVLRTDQSTACLFTSAFASPAARILEPTLAVHIGPV